MRAKEFLFEYRRDITASRFGNRLLDALAEVRYPARGLGDAQFLIVYGKHGFDKPSDASFEINIDGYHTLTSDNVKELYEKLKPTIINKIIEYFEKQDPTPNKQYTPWMLQAFINGPNAVDMGDFNSHDLIGLFHRFKQRLKPEDRDINQYRTYRDFWNTILPYNLHDIGEEDSDKGNSEEVYKDETVRVIKPLDQAAACYYGRGTIWCTASTKSYNFFNDYNDEGPLYIFLPANREREKERYQIHFPREEFTDEDNEQVAISKLVKKFPGFFKKYIEDNPDAEINEYIFFAKDEDLDEISQAIHKLTLKKLEELMWEQATDEAERDEEWRDAIEQGADLEDYLKYNRDARNMLIDVDRAWQHIRPRDIREISDDMYEGGEEDVIKVQNIPNIIAYEIDQNHIRSKDDVYEIAEWIKNRVMVVPPEYVHQYVPRQDFKDPIRTKNGFIVAMKGGYSN